MKRTLVIRWGAYGDMMYALPAMEVLREKCDYLHLETGDRGEQLFKHHPIFDKITVYDIARFPHDDRMPIAKARWADLSEGFDTVVNLWQSLEVMCVTEEWMPEHQWPREKRRAKFGVVSMKEAAFRGAGLPVPDDIHPTFYFGDEELKWAEKWREDHGDEFIVTISPVGSTPQKAPMYLNEVCKEITAAWPDTRYVILGDMNTEITNLKPKARKGHVLRVDNKWPYLQSLMCVKLSDYCIGPETSMLVGAGMFGVPKTALPTSTSVYQMCDGDHNDFSIQSTCSCSPCFRSIYHCGYCQHRPYRKLAAVPDCNFTYNQTTIDKIMEGVQFARDMRGVRRSVENYTGPGFTTLPNLRSLPVQ